MCPFWWSQGAKETMQLARPLEVATITTVNTEAQAQGGCFLFYSPKVNQKLLRRLSNFPLNRS